MEALGVLFIVGIIFAVVISNSKQKQKMEATFGWLGGKLGGGYDIAKRRAWGNLANATVEYRFTTRGSGKSATYWTEIDAEVPPQYPLRLFIRKHGWADQGKIERGEMIDVIVDDRAFDDRFLVEAAPADIARMLLDPRERSYLLGLSETLWLEITTVKDGDRALLRLAIRTWIYDIGDATRGIEAMAAIAGRLRDAYSKVEEASETRDVGSPYRPMLDDGAARESADARLQEVARVDRIRTDRAAREQMVAVVIIVGFVLGCIFVLAASH